MIKRLEKMPVPVLPTFVGLLTLSNVYGAIPGCAMRSWRRRPL